MPVAFSNHLSASPLPFPPPPFPLPLIELQSLGSSQTLIGYLGDVFSIELRLLKARLCVIVRVFIFMIFVWILPCYLNLFLDTIISRAIKVWSWYKIQSSTDKCFYATVSDMLGGFSQPPTTAERAVMKSLSTAQTTNQWTAVLGSRKSESS